MTPTFEQLHEEYRPRVRSYLSRFVDGAEAEDLCQEVFLRVHEKLGTFRHESRPSTWIFQIATHAALDRLKSAEHRRLKSAGIIDELSDFEAFHISAHTESERTQMNTCIQNLVRQLPPDYQTVLVLSEMQDLSSAEIALILNDTQGAVKIRLHRARKALKTLMEKACTIYLDDRAEIACDKKS